MPASLLDLRTPGDPGGRPKPTHPTELIGSAPFVRERITFSLLVNLSVRSTKLSNHFVVFLALRDRPSRYCALIP